MKLKDVAKILKSQIVKYGVPCTIKLKDGKVIASFAMTRRLWKNDKSKMEPSFSRLGKIDRDYFVCVVPYDCDVSSCTEEDTVTILGKDYYFVRAEETVVGNELLYYTGVFREIKEGTDVFV